MDKVWNNFKTAVLLGGLMGLCLAVGYLIGGQSALLPALGIGAALNLGAFYFSDRIALATMRARELQPGEDPVLQEIVERLAHDSGLPAPRVYVSPAAAPNAFATGRGPRHSAVCVTQGLRRMLDRAEIEGVIAHELSHIKHRDILISTVAAIVAGAISMLAYLAFFMGRDDDEGNPLVAILLLIFAPIAAGIIQMAISRSREFEADREGAEIAGSPRGLASALRKLDAASRQVRLPVPETQSGLFIVRPFTGKRMAKLFMSHPPIEERLARLQAMGR